MTKNSLKDYLTHIDMEKYWNGSRGKKNPLVKKAAKKHLRSVERGYVNRGGDHPAQVREKEGNPKGVSSRSRGTWRTFSKKKEENNRLLGKIQKKPLGHPLEKMNHSRSRDAQKKRSECGIFSNLPVRVGR